MNAVEWIIIPALIFLVPVIRSVTDHLEEKARIKAGAVKDALELEKLKQENFIIETEKMRIELETMRLQSPTSNIDFTLTKKEF